MALDPLLIEILVCPTDKGSLVVLDAEDTLYNPRLRRRYQIRDGIPVMLPEEADEVDEAEHERLMALADGAPTTGSPAAGSSADD
ncbi:MAG: Trm112 family protein [Nocardiopsis sp. BM-2018]|nr:MAG: Trm112 family protein [Nocardiopsis sp. BM-2018]